MSESTHIVTELPVIVPAVEEKIYPRASSLKRYFLCPGSFHAELAVPNREVINKIAQSGTKIHAFLAGDDIDLTIREEWTAERCRDLEDGILTDLDIPSVNAHIEEHLEFHYDGELLLRGTPDVVYFYEENTKALLVDWKTGFVGADSAEMNYQIAIYAVMIVQKYPTVQEIHVAIIQPNAPKKYSVAHYTLDDLQFAAESVAAKCREVMGSTNLRRVPGEAQCQYCRARGSCPEAMILAESTINRSAHLAEQVGSASNQEINAFLLQKKLAEEIIKAVTIEARERLKVDPNCLPDFKLGGATSQREFTSLPAVIKAADGVIEPLAIYEKATIGIGSVEELHKEATGLKGESLKSEFNDLFEKCITLKPKEPSLIRKK